MAAAQPTVQPYTRTQPSYPHHRQKNRGKEGKGRGRNRKKQSRSGVLIWNDTHDAHPRLSCVPLLVLFVVIVIVFLIRILCQMLWMATGKGRDEMTSSNGKR